MVLKVCKHGIRTGNSLKFGKTSVEQRQYRKQGLIIREPILNDENIAKENVLGDIDFRSSRVPYSMNKKGRWDLPDIIKTAIEDGDFEDTPVTVQLVERHKLLKRTNCLSVHSSKSPSYSGQEGGSFKRDAKDGYLNAESILAPRKCSLTRRERRNRYRRGEYDFNEHTMVVPSAVRYEVLYPPSPTSDLSYSRKYTGINERVELHCCCRRRCVHEDDSQKIGHNRKRSRNEILEEVAYVRSEDYELDQLPYDLDELDCYSSDRTNTVMFGDFFTDIAAVKKEKHRKRKRSRTESETSDDSVTAKGHIVYEPVHVNTNTSTNVAKEVFTAELSVEKNRMEPILVTLSNEDVDVQTLKNKFGHLYVECDSFPRKFIIDISEHARCVRPCLETADNGHDELIACVTFCWDIDNSCNTDTESIYKVTLKMSDTTNYSKIETLFDYMVTTVEECRNRSVLFIETLPVNEECHFKVTPTGFIHHPKKNRTSVEKCANWETDVFVPNKSFYYSNYLSSFKNHTNDIAIVHQHDRDIIGMDFECVRIADTYPTDTLREKACLAGKTCDICYELLNDLVPGTALAACEHWFCDECWTEYLESRVNRGATYLTCPELDCDEHVDAGTVVTLLNLRDVIRHAKIRHDNMVERGNDTKWCPNAKCGGVLKVNTSNAKIVNCNCGKVACFDCLGASHWPAPCHDVTNYNKRLHETGDIGLVPVDVVDQVVVNGKNCPHCNKFVEKDGGCPYMSCICGSSFCWGCGKDWNINSHSSKCYRLGYNDKHDTTEVSVEDERLKRHSKKKEWYNIAVKYRVEQHPLKLQKMKAAKKQLVTHLSSFIGKSAKTGVIISLKFKGQRDSYRNEQEKLPEYLTELISLYQELNQVAEYTAILTNSNEIPPEKVLRLQYTINRLSNFASGIYTGFVKGLQTKPGELLVSFRKVRVDSQRIINGLFKLVHGDLEREIEE